MIDLDDITPFLFRSYPDFECCRNEEQKKYIEEERRYLGIAWDRKVISVDSAQNDCDFEYSIDNEDLKTATKIHEQAIAAEEEWDIVSDVDLYGFSKSTDYENAVTLYLDAFWDGEDRIAAFNLAQLFSYLNNLIERATAIEDGPATYFFDWLYMEKNIDYRDFEWLYRRSIAAGNVQYATCQLAKLIERHPEEFFEAAGRHKYDHLEDIKWAEEQAKEFYERAIATKHN